MKTPSKEICANCGHPKDYHSGDWCQGNEDSCPCSKFTPSKNSNSEQERASLVASQSTSNKRDMGTAPSNSNYNLRPSRELGERPSEQSQESPPANSNEEIKEMLRNMQDKSIQRKYISNGDFRRLEEAIKKALSKKDEEIKKLKKEISEKADYIYKLEFGIEEFNKENQKLNNKRDYWEKKFKKADEEIKKLKTEAKLGNIPYKEAIKLKEENQTHLSKLRELKDKIEDAQEDYANLDWVSILDWVSKDQAIKIIDILFSELKEEKSP